MRLTDRLLPLALVAAAACGAAPATQPRPVAPARAPAALDDAALRGPFLWEVTGPGVARPSYLFGTIHAGFHADRELPALVWDKLAAADTFVMEADMTQVSPIKLMERASLPAGQSLDVLLGPADWARLQVAAGGLPDGSLRVLAPWFVYSLVMQTLYPTPVPLDLALQQRARALGKQMTYLEDWEFQVGLLSELMGLDDLRELLADRSTARTQLDQLVTAYRDGDFTRIGHLALDPKELAEHPDRVRRMFDERNRAWVADLGPELARGGLFVAVGVGHFAGEQGLVALLRARGLTVRRIVR